jgi:ATP-dependent DNA helicase PIF1
MSKKAKKEQFDSFLTPTQKKALDYLKMDLNCFISGPAGTGKSFLISHYVKHYNKKIPILSSTGASAVLVNGRTVHSFFSLGAMSEEFYVIINRIYGNPKLLAKLTTLKEVIIDEVSMLSGKAFDMIDLILKEIKQNDLPFGGVRFICVGDFHQLPPIDRIDNRPDYAFMSKSWRNARFICFELQEFMRQKDAEFLDVLNNIRQGVCTDKDDAFIKSLALKKGENFEGSRLFGKKDKVFHYNMQKLNEIKSETYTYITTFEGDQKSIERLRKNLPIDDVVQLKVGALVMIRVNDNKKHEYVNGTMGKIIDLRPNAVLIEKFDGDRVLLEPHKFELKDGDGFVLASGKGIPCSIAYSCSIHKSQGTTIDKCIVDLSQTWDGAMIYVALSRATTKEGLKVEGWTRSKVGCDHLVKRYYHWIKENQKKL